MNILYLANADYAGVGDKYYRAINTTFGGKHVAQHVAYHRHRMQYPIQHFAPKPSKLDKLIAWADVVHLFDAWQQFRKRVRDKPLVVTYNGTYYRNHHKNADRIARRRGIVQLCTTLDLTRYGALWMPVPMRDHGIRMRERGDKRWRAVHAPSKPSIKGTEEFKRLMRKLPDVELEIIQGATNAQCIKRKANADIMLNEFVLGYGVNAIESWWIGQVVVSGVEDQWIADKMRQVIGYIPFTRINRRRFLRVMRRLINDEKYYEEMRQKGIQYVNDYHEPSIVARKLLEIYEGLV